MHNYGFPVILSKTIHYTRKGIPFLVVVRKG
jgi:hypothetical protein